MRGKFSTLCAGLSVVGFLSEEVSGDELDQQNQSDAANLPAKYHALPANYQSEAMAAIHEMMEAVHDIGAIDKQTMREFDDACLTPVRPLTPEEIRAIR